MTTTKRTATAPTDTPTTETTPAIGSPDTVINAAPAPADTPVIGGPLRIGEEPLTVTLSHHLTVDGRDYVPGTTLRVSPAYARSLTVNGYIPKA
jgi:hypothetical protein